MNDQVTDIIGRRTKNWLPLDQWGPICEGCGGDEFRIDGFCSIECRDYHCDEEVGVLADYIRMLEGKAG